MSTPSESDFVAELKRAWPRESDAAVDLLKRADDAALAWPRSVAILRLRAALIQMAPEDSPYSLDEALTCYKQALEIDPTSVETLEDVAHFYDAVLGNESEARTYFRLANQERERQGMPPNTSLEQTRDE